MGIMAIANIKKIASTSTPGGGGGGGSTPSGMGAQQGASPSSEFSSGSFELGSSGSAPEPVQAFVVTDSMTNSQDRLSSIRRRATI